MSETTDDKMRPLTKLTVLARLARAAKPFVRHNSAWMDKQPAEDRSSTYPVHTFGELRALIGAIEAAEFLLRHAPQWECLGRKQSLPEPGECDWPVCGCDPHADKVIAALQESGLLKSPDREIGDKHGN